MTRQFKRPSKVILYLARERYRVADSVLIFAAGYTFNNLFAALGLAAVSLMVNTAINLKLRSYK